MDKLHEKLNFRGKKVVLLCIDALFVVAAYFISTFFDLDMKMLPEYTQMLVIRLIYVIPLYLTLFYVFRLYNSIWEYAGVNELMQCVVASSLATVASMGIDIIMVRSNLLGIRNIGISIYFTATLLIIALCGAVRLLYRMFRRSGRIGAIFEKGDFKRIMIIGAGDMGMIIAHELEANGYRLGRPIVFVDDDKYKHNNRMCGIPVKGGCENIQLIANQFNIDEIIFAIPSAPAERQLEILRIAMETGCKLKTSPTLLEMSNDEDNVKAIRNVEVTDLLARPEIKLDAEVCDYLTGQTVLVTGGGGSIGSELCRQVGLYTPKRLIIFDNYENNAFILKNELDRTLKGRVKVYIRIGSVQDINRLNEVFAEFKPSVVFHAAAHKHVPLMEDSPCEAIKNNVFGTYNAAVAAINNKVRKFVILSTDKAVNPANVMGASKRVTEMIIQYFDRKKTGTSFAAVRFGNVLGSNGSVIPIFKNQIENGGPVTVTDKNITRYFMTIPEAAQLVVQAGGFAKGGEIFVLDMGEPVKILTLAENLIKLSGHKPYSEIPIVFSGLRPGEKLYEELTLSEEEEEMHLTGNNKIFVLSPINFDDAELEKGLEKLKNVNKDNVRSLLKELVPNFVEEHGYEI